MRSWGTLEELANTAQRVYGVAVVGGRVVWVDEYGPQRELALYALDSGVATLVGVVPSSGNAMGSPLVADGDRNRVLFAPGGAIESLDVNSGADKMLAATSASHAITRDEAWIYWTTTLASVERMPITQQ